MREAYPFCVCITSFPRAFDASRTEGTATRLTLPEMTAFVVCSSMSRPVSSSACTRAFVLATLIVCAVTFYRHTYVSTQV